MASPANKPHAAFMDARLRSEARPYFPSCGSPIGYNNLLNV
jgi:hypothetical protein